MFLRKDRRKYVAQLDLGVDDAGRRLVWRWYAPDDSPESYAQAKRMLAKAVSERSDGSALVLDDQSVAEYLAYWLDNQVRPNRSPRTFESYESIVRLHLAPALGKVPLRGLAPPHVVSMLAGMRERGIGSRSQELAFAVLHAALRQAVKWGVVSTNVVDRVDKPKHRVPEKRTFSLEEALRFLAVVSGDRLEALWVTTLALGLRRGEVTGLRWQDVDLEAGVLRSEYQLSRVGGEYALREHKTARSKRRLPLPSFVAESLRAHRARQEAEGSAHPWGLVFTTPQGSPLNGPSLSHRFKELVAAAGLPDLDLHDLRHTAGSFLAMEGTPASVIRDMLGHSQLSTTDRYLHSLPSEHKAAMERMGRLLGGARDGSAKDGSD